MERACRICGYPLGEPDSHCPNCGTVCSEPACKSVNVEQPPAPPQPKQHKLPPAIFVGIALILILVCLLIWNPFQPEATAPSISHTQPTASALPSPPPTTLPPTLPTTIAPTVPATVPVTVPGPQTPANQIKLNWTMDAKVVRSDATLVSNTTVTLKGLIAIEEDAADILLLDIVFLPTFRYMAYGIEEYPASLEPGRVGPYYISSFYFYDRTENEPAFLIFALDPEAECAIFILPEDPEQYLVCSTATDVNAQEVLAHFQAFIDLHK